MVSVHLGTVEGLVKLDEGILKLYISSNQILAFISAEDVEQIPTTNFEFENRALRINLSKLWKNIYTNNAF